MEKKKGRQCRALSDELWEEIKESIPKKQRDANRYYRRAPEGIFCVLRTGRPWKAGPREYGCGSRIHRYFQDWQAAGFFEKTGVPGPEKYDDLKKTGRD